LAAAGAAPTLSGESGKKREKNERPESDHRRAFEPPAMQAGDPQHPKRGGQNGVGLGTELERLVPKAARLRHLLGDVEEWEASERAAGV
jgi:hypothetical protein